MSGRPGTAENELEAFEPLIAQERIEMVYIDTISRKWSLDLPLTRLPMSHVLISRIFKHDCLPRGGGLSTLKLSFHSSPRRGECGASRPELVPDQSCLFQIGALVAVATRSLMLNPLSARRYFQPPLENRQLPNIRCTTVFDDEPKPLLLNQGFFIFSLVLHKLLIRFSIIIVVCWPR